MTGVDAFPRRLVIAAGRGWTSEAIEPPLVEPDPPQDFEASLSAVVNAAAARDLETGPDGTRTRPSGATPSAINALGPEPSVPANARRSSSVEGHGGATPLAGSERAGAHPISHAEPTPRGPAPAAPISHAPGITLPGTPGGGPGRNAQREAATFPGMRWTEHADHPCTITEHHAHEALGSSSLRRYLSDQQPTKKVGHLGNAVGWLATTPEHRWSKPSAAVVQRPNLSGHPGGIAAWEAEHPGVVGLSAREYGMAAAMASALQEHPRMRRLLSSSAIQVEHTVLARHVETGVLCKSRPDLRLPGVWLGDLKITRSTDLVSFAYSVGDYGYDAQAWLYSDIEASRYGLERLRLGYDLIVVSETAPHRVAVWSMPPAWLDRGRRLIEAALQLRRLHQETGDRPPLWWEMPQYLPDPSRTDRERDQRIHDHVHELLRLRHREDTRDRADGSDPGRRTA